MAGNSIASLEKAIRTLDVISQSSRELSIADLTQITGFSRGTIQRTTHTLCAIGMLRRIEGSSFFELGTRIVRQAYNFLTGHPLIEVAMPYLVELNAELELSCDVWLVDGTDMILAAHTPLLNGNEPMTAVGLRVSALSHPASRGVFAALSEEDRNTWASEVPEKVVRSFDAESARVQVRKSGYYVEENTPNGGGTVCSATITDFHGCPVAAISTTIGPKEDRDSDKARRVGQQLADCARSLSSMRIRPQRDHGFPHVGAVLQAKNSHETKDALFLSAVGRGFDLLDCLSASTPALTLTQLHEYSGFSVPMLQRLTNTLTQSGCLARDPERKTYSLTPHTLDLLYGYQSKNQSLKVLWPKLLKLRRLSGLRVSFCILDGEFIAHLLHLQGGHHEDFRPAFVGQSLPALSTSGGRMLLSHLSDAKLAEYLDRYDVHKRTPRTITDKTAILRLLQEARDTGIAFTDEQSIVGEVNVAIPVYRHQRKPLGAVVVSAPKPSWTTKRLDDEIVPLMRRIV